MTVVKQDPHPLLLARAFVTTFAAPLGEGVAPAEWAGWMRLGASAPIAAEDAVRAQVRDLLRWGGFKPTGRSKPASEYLLKAAEEGLSTINLAVDACNIVSLHAGLPISVVDLDRVRGALRIGVAPAGASYVFNASGQSIDLGGLLCLSDEDGPCANAVKDAQRTKTHAATTQTLSVIWAPKGLAAQSAKAEVWYRSLLEAAGAQTQGVEIQIEIASPPEGTG